MGAPITRHRLYELVEFEKLEKGTYIETEMLEDAFGLERDKNDYLANMLSLAGTIERKRGILCRIEGRRLRLMTDAEAVVWNVKQAEKASRMLDRSAERLRTRIDTKNLSDVQKVAHEHATRVVTAMAEAQRREREKASRLMLALSAPKASVRHE